MIQSLPPGAQQNVSNHLTTDKKAQGRGGWIERRAGGKLHAPLDRWKAPPELQRFKLPMPELT